MDFLHVLHACSYKKRWQLATTASIVWPVLEKRKKKRTDDPGRKKVKYSLASPNLRQPYTHGTVHPGSPPRQGFGGQAACMHVCVSVLSASAAVVSGAITVSIIRCAQTNMVESWFLIPRWRWMGYFTGQGIKTRPRLFSFLQLFAWYGCMMAEGRRLGWCFSLLC